MRLIGKPSMASFLKVVLDVFWYLIFLHAALFSIFFGYALSNPGAEVEDAYIQVPCRVEALDIERGKITEAERYVDPNVVSHNPSNYYYNVRATETLLRFRTHDRRALSLYLLFILAWDAILLFIFLNLRRIFDTLKSGSPFVMESAGRLRSVGVAVCATQPFLWLAGSILNLVVIRGAFSLFGKPLTVAVWSRSSLSVIVLGLMIVVISEVFRIGVRMREEKDELQKEQELTV